MGAKKTQEHRTKIAEAVRRSWQKRRHRRFVYLAGSMTGKSSDEATGWRRKATTALERAGLTVLDPTRRDKDMEPDEVYENGQLTDEARGFIYESDLRDIGIAHVILLNLDPEDLSIGALWEVGYADKAGKEIVIVANTEKNMTHPFVAGSHARAFLTMTEALVHVIKTHGKVGI